MGEKCSHNYISKRPVLTNSHKFVTCIRMSLAMDTINNYGQYPINNYLDHCATALVIFWIHNDFLTFHCIGCYALSALLR